MQKNTDQELTSWAVTSYTASGWRITQRNEYGVQLERSNPASTGTIIVSVILTLLFATVTGVLFLPLGVLVFLVGVGIVIYQIVSKQTERAWVDITVAQQMQQRWQQQHGSQSR
ncbi:MAG: hypothetical protein GFH27_549279n301 [Chloroflexi bacterium AL-W]|nr:hypothetical protein [Chloroflexi bacterium AL-N1]NOK65267.1 hypothetical protein [Chloroflexi bacterium AL-N10]NOK72468.1 hypothetical protein [Chloroflexi bacterium AL-N5]NOK79446.1 hypothetical protein [Chloroflexi bacterium AL-W]NOK87362.1 hypothetical protein [Chloroflexi bacterium AL-N15]